MDQRYTARPAEDAEAEDVVEELEVLGATNITKSDDDKTVSFNADAAVVATVEASVLIDKVTEVDEEDEEAA